MAASPKSGGPTPDDVMAPAALKPLLALSKREPVSAAVGVTADKLGVVLLRKNMKPKKVLADLRAESKKMQLGLDNASLRFGTAEVDTEIDSALVRFRINKEAPGMLGPKLRDHLKKAGFAKVEFIVDPSLEADEDDAPPDWDKLAAELMDLAKKIAPAAAGNAERQKALVQLAGTANAGTKARADFAVAQGAVQALRQGLMDAARQAKASQAGSAQTGPAQTGPAQTGSAQTGAAQTGAAQTGAATTSSAQAGSAPASKAVPVWQTAKDEVDGRLRALADALRKTGIPELNDLAGDVETFLEEIRVGLLTALMNYDNAPADQALKTAALAAVESALTWVETDERVREVDDNAFAIAIAAAPTLGGALRQLQHSLGDAGAHA